MMVHCEQTFSRCDDSLDVTSTGNPGTTLVSVQLVLKESFILNRFPLAGIKGEDLHA